MDTPVGIQWGYGEYRGEKYVWHEGMRCNNRQQRER